MIISYLRHVSSLPLVQTIIVCVSVFAKWNELMKCLELVKET